MRHIHFILACEYDILYDYESLYSTMRSCKVRIETLRGVQETDGRSRNESTMRDDDRMMPRRHCDVGMTSMWLSRNSSAIEHIIIWERGPSLRRDHRICIGIRRWEKKSLSNAPFPLQNTNPPPRPSNYILTMPTQYQVILGKFSMLGCCRREGAKKKKKKKNAQREAHVLTHKLSRPTSGKEINLIFSFVSADVCSPPKSPITIFYPPAQG